MLDQVVIPPLLDHRRLVLSVQLLEAQLAVELSSLVSWRCWLLEALFAWFALADVVFQKSDHHSIESSKGAFEDNEEEQAQ